MHKHLFFQTKRKQLFRMHWQRCEPRQIYEEMSLLLRLNSFFFMTHYFGDASFDIQKVELVFATIVSFSK